MAENTGISWADHTFNPWWGCAKVSPACRFCYANSTDKRWGGEHWGRKASRKLMSDNYWRQPLKWNRQAAAEGKTLRVFAASMADVFEDHPDVLDARRRLFELIEQTPHLVWMLLTKRPENVAGMVPWGNSWPDSVWLGVSAETQRFADQRIPILLSLPVAGVKFVSAAPLLGSVDLDQPRCDDHGRLEVVTDADGREWCGYCVADGFTGELSYGHWLNPLNGGIGWVITEGESGPKARPTHPAWFRSLRDQCAVNEVVFHHKQNGEWVSPNDIDTAGMDDVAWNESGITMWPDGRIVAGPAGTCTDGSETLWRVGLKRAGRLLDGKLHAGHPVAREAVAA